MVSNGINLLLQLFFLKLLAVVFIFYLYLLTVQPRSTWFIVENSPSLTFCSDCLYYSATNPVSNLNISATSNSNSKRL
jgi:hypothetical protein